MKKLLFYIVAFDLYILTTSFSITDNLNLQNGQNEVVNYIEECEQMDTKVVPC